MIKKIVRNWRLFDSGFMVAGIAGILALLGDFIWLVYDNLIRHYVGEHSLVYVFIGSLFLAAIYLIIRAMVLFKTSGVFQHETHLEYEHKKSKSKKKIITSNKLLK